MPPRKTPLRSKGRKAGGFGKQAELKRSGWIARKKGVNPINRERKERDRGDRVYGPYHKWISTLPCVIGGNCFGPVKGHHVKSVGARGEDFGNEVPLCVKHHDEGHTGGWKSFAAKYSIDLQERAYRLAILYPGVK